MKIKYALSFILVPVFLFPGTETGFLQDDSLRQLHVLCSNTTAVSEMINTDIDKTIIREKQPLKAGKVALEFLAGGAGGNLAGLGLGLMMRTEGGWGTGFILGYLVGYTLGCPFGVYLVGNTGNQRGSFGSTILGNLVGIACAVGFVAIVPEEGEMRGLAFSSLFIFPVLGSVIGFNMSRRYDIQSSSGSALLNIRDGRVSMTCPAIGLRPNTHMENDWITTVRLVHVQF